jgi:hypothetical protein
MHINFKFRLVILLFILLSGCASIGPRQIKLDRNRYNSIIQTTNNQQLLENIVRLHYLEPVSFLRVTNVTASYTLNPTIKPFPMLNYQSGLVSNGQSGHLTSSTGSLETDISYSDSPTITYAPVDNAEFINALLTPITLNEMALLYSGGVSNPKLLDRIVVQSVNDIDNASEASDVYAVNVPQYKEYYKLLELIDSLKVRNGFKFLPVEVDDSYTLMMHFIKPYKTSPISNQIRAILHVPQDDKDIRWTEKTAVWAKDNHSILIRTRSVLGILSYLSHGVKVPPEDLKKGYIIHTRYPDGREFLWDPLMDGIFRVYYSKFSPDDAFVKIRFRKYWFYIRNDDLTSKATFSLVTRLFTLTAGMQRSGQEGPMLTVPVRAP